MADRIDANQLGRRNLMPDRYSLLRGRRYNRAKKPKGGDLKPVPQTVGVITAETLALQHGVCQANIERDGEFTTTVEKVSAVDPKTEAKVVHGKAPSKVAVVEAAW
jgi:hypothetical protein